MSISRIIELFFVLKIVLRILHNHIFVSGSNIMMRSEQYEDTGN